MALLSDRIVVDFDRQTPPRWRIALLTVLTVSLSSELGMQDGEDKAEGLVIAGIAFAVVSAVVAVGFPLGRRSLARRAGRLRAAGFTPVTDADGRPVSAAGGRLPGHGNPFAPWPESPQPPGPTV